MFWDFQTSLRFENLKHRTPQSNKPPKIGTLKPLSLKISVFITKKMYQREKRFFLIFKNYLFFRFFNMAKNYVSNTYYSKIPCSNYIKVIFCKIKDPMEQKRYPKYHKIAKHIIFKIYKILSITIASFSKKS